MAFDWTGAIELKRLAVLAIVVRLLSMAGLRPDGSVAPRNIGIAAIPYRFHRAIRLVLRQAESCVRRIVFMAACALQVTVPPLKPARSYSSPHRGEGGQPVEPEAKQAVRMRGPSDESAPPPRAQSQMEQAPAIPLPALRTFMPWKRDQAPSAATIMATAPFAPAREGKPASDRIPAFQLFDPFPRSDARGWTYGDETMAGGFAPWRGPGKHPAFSPWDEIEATGIRKRLQALAHALSTLEAHALRLARWRARRDRYPGYKLGRVSPLILGHPPGWRKRPVHEIDGILRECNTLAICARKDFDTS